jgi:hypothetical protein
MNKKSLLAVLIIGASVALPAISEARVNVDIDIGPPVVRVERPPPPPQVGYVWAPGYWNWAGNRHVWVDGHYIAPRRGAIWIPDHWVQRGPHYHFVPGHWRRR